MKGAIEWGNKITAGFILLFTLLAVFAPSMPIITPFTEYFFHFLVIMLISGLIGLIIDNRIVLFTSFGCAMILAIFLKNASNEDLRPPVANHNTSIKVAHVNLSSVPDADALYKILTMDSLVEIYSFQEYTPDWASILPTMMEAFPHVISEIQIDVFGKAIFSKHPYAAQSQPTHGGVKMIEINVAKNNDTFKIASTYIIPALDSTSSSKARIQIKESQDYFKINKKNLIVMGEFNQVYWSPDIIEFRKQSNLSNSRRDVNIGTKMPYNHIFYSSNLECFSFAEIIVSDGTQVGCIGSFQIKNPLDIRE